MPLLPSRHTHPRSAVIEDMRLEGNRWLIEKKNSAGNMVVSEADTRQSVCVYDSEAICLNVASKVNAVTMGNTGWKKKES